MTSTTHLFNAATVEARCDMAQDFADAGAWIACDLGAELPPKMTIQVPVPRCLDHQGKRDWLQALARSWKVDVLPDGAGGELAVKQFGSLKFTASVAAHYATMDEYLDAKKAQQAMRAGTEVAA